MDHAFSRPFTATSRAVHDVACESGGAPGSESSTGGIKKKEPEVKEETDVEA
ncbi:hypothetical protein CEP54_000133 [Fusarium duplospermum]|uniref:Uncharacterized protein n=1 Tax=Fusarium duplospermum TaxID=1325734 RepID=A0A428R8A5_9HYPO|nr:hypothetical protein CEP54_000133 [Fusarium duplospermum]